mmetsp:Transcript_164818/g.528847  ORF Transcript_164818/g.528847 Transcript_164818/m.528847 type:complete len:240 (-) Transcript_164818:844-1563(-)
MRGLTRELRTVVHMLLGPQKGEEEQVDVGSQGRSMGLRRRGGGWEKRHSRSARWEELMIRETASGDGWTRRPRRSPLSPRRPAAPSRLGARRRPRRCTPSRGRHCRFARRPRRRRWRRRWWRAGLRRRRRFRLSPRQQCTSRSCSRSQRSHGLYGHQKLGRRVPCSCHPGNSSSSSSSSSREHRSGRSSNSSRSRSRQTSGRLGTPTSSRLGRRTTKRHCSRARGDYDHSCRSSRARGD